jgi:type VII secretion-associated serine protease mycosin
MRLRATITAALILGTTIAAPAAVLGLPAAPAWAACPSGMQRNDPPAFTMPKDDAGNWMLLRFGLNRLPRGLNGGGVIVAVLDSGVQPNHPALASQMTTTGHDFLEATDRTHGLEDCRGHGTAVASLIAGNGRAGFRGIAPSADIMSLRVNENEGQSDKEGRPTSDQKIADAIDWAIQHHADVINISFAYLGDEADPDRHTAIVNAIKRAVDNNVVIVAAVGNDKDAKNSFPANQPGVLGVGAIQPDGTHWPDSTKGSFVDVSAPGFSVIAASIGKNSPYQPFQGTSFAAPIVAGTVALLKQQHPDWKTADFIRQITATADRSPGGRSSWEYGAGVLDPVRATTDQFAVGAAYQAPAGEVTAEDPALAAARQAASERRAKAMWLALGVLAVSIIVLFSSAILRNGSERGWRPAE